MLIFLISCFIAVDLAVKHGHSLGKINCYGIEKQKPQGIFDMSHKLHTVVTWEIYEYRNSLDMLPMILLISFFQLILSDV